MRLLLKGAISQITNYKVVSVVSWAYPNLINRKKGCWTVFLTHNLKVKSSKVISVGVIIRVKNQTNSIGESWEFSSIMYSTLALKLMPSVKVK
jgi:hypothetical protein